MTIVSVSTFRSAVPALLSVWLTSVAHGASELPTVTGQDMADGASAPLPAIRVTAAPPREATVGYRPRETATASPTAGALAEVPRAVAVVAGQVMADQQARSLDDVLANVSGVVQTNTLGGTRDAFIKRGFGANDDGSVLVDGVRSPVLHNYLATVERVEVLKGPASLLYGIQEPGGVINLITRQPEPEFGGSVSLTHTSHGGNGAAFDVTGPIGAARQIAGGTLAFRLTGEDQTTRYWRSYGRQRDTLIAPALSWHNANTQISLAYQYVDYTTPFDRGTVLVNGHPDDALRYTRYDEPWASSSGIQEQFRARLEQRLSDAWRVRGVYGWGRDRYDQFIARARSFNRTTGAMSRASDANLGRSDSGELASLGLLGDVGIGSIRHALYFAGEYEQRRSLRGDTIRGSGRGGFDLYDPVYGLLAPGGTVSASQSDSLTEVKTYSLIAQDSAHLTDRLIASAGIRWEDWRQRSGAGRPFVGTDRSHGQAWLPQLGVVYKLAPSLSAYANYSRSFVPNVASNIAAPLAPERGSSYEAGLKFDPLPGLTGTLALYQIDKRNVAVTVGELTQTIGRARSRGVELDVAGRLARHVSVIASYAYTAAVDEADHTPMVGAPRHAGSLFAVYDTMLPHLSGQWRLGGGARFVGKRTGDTANSFTLPGYAVVDLFAAYETKIGTVPARIQLNVKNLFDKTYYPSSNSNLIIAVGEPRLVTLTSTFSF